MGKTFKSLFSDNGKKNHERFFSKTIQLELISKDSVDILISIKYFYSDTK